MTQVSQNLLDKESEEKILDTFHLVLSKIIHAEDMKNFLFTFLNQTEQLMLAKRLTVFLLIKEGNSDSEIASMLHMTRMTIARHRYFIEARGKGYEVAWKIIQDEKISLEIKMLISQLGGYMARAAGGRVKSSIF